MKKYSLLLLSIHLQLNLFSQSDTALLSINYEFGILTDTLNTGNYYKENMMLLIGRNTSLYKSYDKYLLDSAFNEKLSKAQNISDIQFAQRRPTTTTQRIQEFASMNFHYGEDLFSNFYFWEEEKPAFNWEIGSDTSRIFGLLCQKATTRHKGRNWEVWFCSDLPFPTGPWKFYGLPGLIIQATDSKNQVYFKFSGIISMKDNKVQLPTKAIKTTQKDFVKIKNAALENPETFINSSGKFNGTFRLSNLPKPTKTSSTFNNPIELE